jgi:glycosyltransferase involved in cell wall biosynthesis
MAGENDLLKVLMVTPRYFPYIGGIETHVHEVGRRLAASGVEITLLTTMPHTLSTTLPREEIFEGMHIIRVPSWPRQPDYYLAPEIYSIIGSGEWDLVHCQGCNTFVPPVAMLAARKAKIPYIVTFHSGGHSSRLRTQMRSIQWKLLRPLFADASKLIGVSRFDAYHFRDLLHLPAEKFSVIPNGITLPDLSKLTSNTSKRPLIISVGRLERYKGHQRIIAALPKIREQRPETELLILGAGPYETTLRQLANKFDVAEHVAIRSIPASDRQAMVDILSQASLVTLLSEFEGHPIAILEALALRRPILVTDTSGLRELAEQKLALAIPISSTAEEVATAALRQLEQPFIPAQLALPTWDDCTQQLHAIYNSCLGREKCAS